MMLGLARRDVYMKRKRPITASSRPLKLKGQALIRRVHRIQSDIHSASSSGDQELCESLERELSDLGGLEAYQRASIKGQDKRRGGDSSKQLVDWLEPLDRDFAVLEIGSLSVDNFISQYVKAKVTRIDLNPQHQEIEKQDFLERVEGTGFDLLSVSLVLNFVPVTKRSDFLIHTTKFVAIDGYLFFVLPAPCIKNSRYMNKTILLDMFRTLGYQVENEKVTDKIAYWLFKRVAEITPAKTYKKREIQGGAEKNNFWIPLVT